MSTMRTQLKQATDRSEELDKVTNHREIRYANAMRRPSCKSKIKKKKEKKKKKKESSRPECSLAYVYKPLSFWCVRVRVRDGGKGKVDLLSGLGLW